MQNPDRQIIAPTVYQDVAFGPTNLGLPETAVHAAVANALHQVGLEGFDRRPPHQLSGGEKRRVAIAGVLAMDPDLLVLDEPTSGLDPSGSEEIMELLDELNQDGKTIFISTHDIELAYPWADRAILMVDGRILQEDVPEIAFGDPYLVRRAHLSLPPLLELHAELEKRGYPVPEKKPRSILDMIRTIGNLVSGPGRSPSPGSITLFIVDRDDPGQLLSWIAAHPGAPVGAMGTSAKRLAARLKVNAEFTYGVIDKCILRSLLGERSLILVTGKMEDRIRMRMERYGIESGNQIPILAFGESGE